MKKEQFFNREPIVYEGVKLKLVKAKTLQSCEGCYFKGLRGFDCGFYPFAECFMPYVLANGGLSGIYVKVED